MGAEEAEGRPVGVHLTTAVAIRRRSSSEPRDDTPEVLVVPEVDVDDRYFSWLKDSVHREARDGPATPTEDPP